MKTPSHKTPSHSTLCYERACIAETAALKISNTHLWGWSKTPLLVFHQAAQETAEPMCRSSYGVGQKIYHSARATKKAVGENPNIGMLLLAAPLIKTFEEYGDCKPKNLQKTLADLTTTDSNYVFKALRLLRPKSLKASAPNQDVFAPATLPLVKVMALAQKQDLVACQYANNFPQVYKGCAFLLKNKDNKAVLANLAARLHLKFLALGDTHIKKAYSAKLAKQAAKLAVSLEKSINWKGFWSLKPLYQADIKLKKLGVNAGSSADLTFACLLVAFLNRWW